MFTDSPATPIRVEVLIEVISKMRQRKLDRAALKRLIQPEGLPDIKSGSSQAFETLRAATELGLVKEDSERNIRPAWNSRNESSPRELLLSAVDEKVLASTDIEPWFGRFYSFLIAKEKDVAAPGGAGTKWAEDFNRDLYGGSPARDPFNKDKYIGLRRWFRYCGLGWHDLKDNFVPCPYERLQRQLPSIFGKDTKLDAESFMTRLATHCPELDGGEIFKQANPNFNERECTRALASALRDLHDDGVIRLECPADSRGWGLAKAGPVRDPAQGLLSDVFDFVEMRRKS
jgi:hypothetical protein